MREQNHHLLSVPESQWFCYFSSPPKVHARNEGQWDFRANSLGQSLAGCSKILSFPCCSNTKSSNKSQQQHGSKFRHSKYSCFFHKSWKSWQLIMLVSCGRCNTSPEASFLNCISCLKNQPLPLMLSLLSSFPCLFAINIFNDKLTNEGD